MKIRECWTGSSRDFCYLKDCLSPLTYRQRCFEKQKRPSTNRGYRFEVVSFVIWKYGTDFFVRRTDSGIYDVTDETAFRIPGKTDCLKRSHHRELFYWTCRARSRSSSSSGSVVSSSTMLCGRFFLVSGSTQTNVINPSTF